MKLLLLLGCLFLLSCTNGHNKYNEKPTVQNSKEIKVAGKSRGFFHINISGKESGAEDYTLTATIFPQKQVSSATLEWKLPDHLKVTDGERETTLDFGQGGRQQVHLAVAKENLKADDQIFLFVYNVIDGEKHGASHSFIYKDSEQVEKSSLKKKPKKPPKFYE